MDERVKEILGTDIDEVVAQGEKSGSKRKIAVVIIVFVALVVGVLGYFINRDAKYKDALHMADIGLYDDALKEFFKLSTYKDSQDNIQKITVAKEFAESSCYQRQCEGINNVFCHNDVNDVLVYLEWETMTVVIQLTLPDSMDFTMEDLQSDELKPAFLNISHSADSLCEILKENSKAEGYSVNYKQEIMRYDGQLLYSTFNGAQTFSCIDGDGA